MARVINAHVSDNDDSNSDASSMRDFIASDSDSDAAHSSDSSFKPPVRPSRVPRVERPASASENNSASDTDESAGSTTSSISEETSGDEDAASADSDGTADVTAQPASEFMWRTPPHPPAGAQPVPALPPPLPNRNQRYPKRERREAIDVYLASNARRVRRVLEADELRDQVREIADWRGVPVPIDNMELLVHVAHDAVRATHARVAADANVVGLEEASQEDDTDADAEEDSDAEVNDSKATSVQTGSDDALLSD
jgi:hypothetical protein